MFVERSEKTACDVNVGQVKKSVKFKTAFFESTWRRSGFSFYKGLGRKIVTQISLRMVLFSVW